MANKLLLPFPLLSDARGELAKTYGLWNDREGVAIPAIVVIDHSGEIRYLYEGSDFADRPDDEELYASLDELRRPSTRRESTKPGQPLIRLSGAAAHNSVRPDRPPITLEQLVPSYRGVYFTTRALKTRFEAMGRSGKKAFRETDRYQSMTTGYADAIKATVSMKES
jgi:hypothetical protein